MLFAQRHAEQAAKLENYRQRIESARAKVAQTSSDINSYAEQYRVAETKEAMRMKLEQMQVGSKLNTLDAGAQRAEVNRALQAAFASHAAAHSDLDGLIAERDGFIQQVKSETAQQLTEQGRKLADAREQQNKASLRRALVDLRADRDAIVLNVAKVSVGSVVQSGDELITLVPTDAPLEVADQHPGPGRRICPARQPRRHQVRHLPLHDLRLCDRHLDHGQRGQLRQPANQPGASRPAGPSASRKRMAAPRSSAARCRWTRSSCTTCRKASG